ncbi:MAG: hypothetical protein ACRCSF_04745 [Mycobacteriaceae bacterium]
MPERDAERTDPNLSSLPPQKRHRWKEITIFSAVILALSIAVISLWYDYRETKTAQNDRLAFLQAGRQAVLNLTTVSTDTVDADIERLLNSSTGAFREDFSARSDSFLSVVKQAQVTTVGQITEAGIESSTSEGAQLLISATSKVTNSSGAQEEPRIWRLRVNMERVDGKILIAKVDFVP